MQCTVYKSIKKFDYYLFIEIKGNFSRVPKQLIDILGRLEQVMELELHPERKLARANIADVIQDLSENGYYLQLPPTV